MPNRIFDIATPLLWALFLAAIAVAASFAAPAMQRVVTEGFIYVVLVLGLYIFAGNSGVTSFGHVSFMILSGYMSALLTLSPQKKHALLALPHFIEQIQLPTPIAAVVASLFAALVALVFGLPAMRLRGIVPSIVTFAFLVIVHVVAQNWKDVTGGRQALAGLPMDTTIWTALIAAITTIFAAAWYQQTRRGALLRCSRENEVAAESIGINIARERMVALVISAFFSGLGGVLFAHFLGTLNANAFYLNTTFMLLAMLVVGGMGSLSGAVSGVLVISLISEVFRTLEHGITLGGMEISAKAGLQEVALALVMLAILLFRREGLFGNTELGPILGRLRSRGTSGKLNQTNA
jgi:branched-chain amino acid transport system permease protein